MYLLYLDDSGSIDNPKEDYFVLGGVCVPERSMHWLSSKLEGLAAGINTKHPNRIEFHASEIFGGRKPPWDQFKTKEKRIQIIKDVLNCLKDAYPDIVTFACAVHKKSYQKQDLMEMAFEDIFSRFDQYLNRLYHESGKKESQRGLILLDKNAHENVLQKLSLKFKQYGTRWRQKGVMNIAEVPCFIDSRASRLIQLADHIAYAVFRRYNANDLTYFNCIENRFDENQGTIHGLAHKQINNPNCTCPACITRKNNQFA